MISGVKEKIIKLLHSKNSEDWAIANELILGHKICIRPKDLGLDDVPVGTSQFYRASDGDLYIQKRDLTWFRIQTLYAELH